LVKFKYLSMPTPKFKKIMPPFFLIRIPKEAQRERLEKIGVLYFPPAFTFMKRGMQCGEIVMIGDAAHKYFPEAKVGDILINHHLSEGKTTDKKQKVYMIDEDDDWNYYVITGFCHNGERNMTFAVWDGEKIIPNKDYIFLEIEKAPESDMPDIDITMPGFGQVVTNIAFQKAKNGIVVPKARTKTREEISEKMKANVLQIKKLSRWLPIMRERVTPMILALERENEQLSKEINTIKCEFRTIAACNPEFMSKYNVSIGDNIFTLNIACYMQVEFMNKEYVIAETKYLSAIP
jgi:hypothetical protein